jgi:hypothetical protein
MTNQPIEWYELKIEERNRLIHTKVMDNPEFCPGQLTVTKKDVPSRAGGNAWSYWQATCSNCEFLWTHTETGQAPLRHIPKVTIPNYCEDINAAMQVATHEKFSHVYFSHVQASPPGHWLCSLYWTDESGERQINTEVASTLPDAICIPALKACGVEVLA